MNNETEIMQAGSTLQPGLAIRRHFPVFSNSSMSPAQPGHLAYLDSAASTQKPLAVIERLRQYLSFEHANIRRGAYALSAAATEKYENSRLKIGGFLNAPSPQGVIFTHGATESINLAAHALGSFFERGDCILLTVLEHHSNIVPWQMLAKRCALRLEYVEVFDDASINLEDFRLKLAKFKPKLLASTLVSNALGTVLPVEEMTAQAHAQGCAVLLDAAQAVAHRRIDVKAMGCDLLAFSGHKLYGPTGIGVLWASDEMLSRMDPFQGGGEMIESVALEGSTWAEAPHKFEAGTPAIAEAIALGTAVEFVETVGLDNIASCEKKLFGEAFELLRKEPGVCLYGPALNQGRQASIIAFNVEGVHPHDLATVADGFNVQIRAGHHCAMPAHKRLGIKSSARASIGVYSCLEDFNLLIEAIRRARKLLA